MNTIFQRNDRRGIPNIYFGKKFPNYTQKIISKDIEEKSSSSFSNAHSKTVVRDERKAKSNEPIYQQIQQKEDQIDKVSHINNCCEEVSDKLLSSARFCFCQTEVVREKNQRNVNNFK